MKKVSFAILIIVELLCAAFSLGQIYFWLERIPAFFVALAVYLAALLFLIFRKGYRYDNKPLSNNKH